MSQRKVWGIGPVRELVTAGASRVEALYVDGKRAGKRGDPVADLAAAARAAGIAVSERSSGDLDRLAEDGARHQGVVAVTGGFVYADLAELAESAGGHGEHGLLVALDGVQDPHNLGAIIRSAYLLGAHGVVVPEHRAAHVTPVVTKASAGATELLPIALVPNLARALVELKEASFWAAAVAMSSESVPIAQLDAHRSLVLVLGAEGTGVRPLVAKSCDFQVHIPMARSGGVDSFNVSVAAALALYEVARQRGERS